MKYSYQSSGGGIVLMLWLGMCVIMGIIGSFLWPYSVNTWLEFLGKDTALSGTQGFFLGMIPGIGWSSIAIAFATFILMLFLS